MSGAQLDKRSGHPCFDKEARASVGFVHLPVAPRCNIQCLFCNRQEDCVQESRPGVSSHVLAPSEAVAHVVRARELDPRVGVVGITGPGDPLANLEAVLETCDRISDVFPEMELCLSTNGLGLTPDTVERLVRAGISHVSVGVNAVDPGVAENLVGRVRDEKVMFGREGAELLIERQLAGIRDLKLRGVHVNVNTVVVQGVNDDHVEAIARAVAEMGADTQNCVGLVPAKGTPLAALGPTPIALLEEVRAIASRWMPQTDHCASCRSDSFGMVGGPDRWAELAPPHHRPEVDSVPARPYVAVASKDGGAVDLHLGAAERFAIWERSGDGIRPVETRSVTGPRGEGRWERLAGLLRDCGAVVVSGAGESPRRTLAALGIAVLERSGPVLEEVDEIFRTLERRALALEPADGGGCDGRGGKKRKREASEGGC